MKRKAYITPIHWRDLGEQSVTVCREVTPGMLCMNVKLSVSFYGGYTLS